MEWLRIVKDNFIWSKNTNLFIEFKANSWKTLSLSSCFYFTKKRKKTFILPKAMFYLNVCIWKIMKLSVKESYAQRDVCIYLFYNLYEWLKKKPVLPFKVWQCLLAASNIGCCIFCRTGFNILEQLLQSIHNLNTDLLLSIKCRFYLLFNTFILKLKALLVFPPWLFSAQLHFRRQVFLLTLLAWRFWFSALSSFFKKVANALND